MSSAAMGINVDGTPLQKLAPVPMLVRSYQPLGAARRYRPLGTVSQYRPLGTARRMSVPTAR